MAILRTDIERALDELVSQEEGMRFQGLAVVLGKKRWPELIARQRKKDFGLDAYAPASLTPERVGKGLAASITPALKKISDDTRTAKANFTDLKMLLFVTSAKVGNADRRLWEKTIEQDYGVELYIVEREEIIALMLTPGNAALCASFLHLEVDVEPQIEALVEKTRRASAVVAQAWAAKTRGQPLIDLTAVRIEPNGSESSDALSVEQIYQALSQSRRIVLEGPAGRGKTTTLIQIAQQACATSMPFIVDLPAWTSSHRGILEYIAGMSAFQAEYLTAAELARVHKTEPFLFLLNGWNEIAESNSERARCAIVELEREFPSAGIIIATRAHHLIPPLPGAWRLRLLRVQRAQRVVYLADRLGVKSTELIARIDADPLLDELASTPFILSEVASLFEAGVAIPTTKMDVIAQVIRLNEQRGEHRNALQSAPIFDRQTDYLKALATEMIRRGAVMLTDSSARAVTAVVAQELLDRGQTQPVGPPPVLAALTAHHVLERVDYPQTAFQFEHQQLQEYFGALDVRNRLLDLQCDDHVSIGCFTANYVDDPAWAEPLRMIAETFAQQTGDVEICKRNISAGRIMVEAALAVDIVFAAELARHCGAIVWNEVRGVVGGKIRAVYVSCDGNFRQYAIAAMLATGADDFCDVLIPLLSGEDHQTRLRTYRLWPEIQVSSLGPNWREQVHGWSEGARVDFVSELLHQHVHGEIAAFAADDDSVAVKNAAASSLMWTGSDESLIRVLESMDIQAFEEVARNHPDRMPTALRAKTIAAMHRFIETTADHPARMRTALALLDLGETGLDDIIKDAMTGISGGNMRNIDFRYLQPALEQLRKTDPDWVSAWVAAQVAEGYIYKNEYWLPFATAISDGLIEKYLRRLEAEDLKDVNFSGMITVIAARADSDLAVRVFVKLRELRRAVEAKPGVRHELEWQIIRQLEEAFREFPDEIASAGILSSISSGGNLVDITVATGLLNRIARSDVEPLRIGDVDLKERLRVYLKSCVEVVLSQDDFNGEGKANLASSIAQIGKPEDMVDLVSLIRADIERVRRGRAAYAAGDRGPLSNGGMVSYAHSHIAAVTHLDAVGAERVLIDLLAEPEYLSVAAAAMAHDFLPKPAHSFERMFRYDLMWAARQGRVPPCANVQRRTRFSAALNAEIKRLREQNHDGKPAVGLKDLAKALAAIDGRGSPEAVLEVIAMPGQWDQYTCLEAAERLLMAGFTLPAATAFVLVDSIVERTAKWMQDSDRHLLIRSLVLCPFVDDPAVGIAKLRDVLSKRRLQGYELCEVVTALGESRSDAAVELLSALASSAPTFERCEDHFINAFAALNTTRACELLLGFVDPDVRGITLARRLDREDVLVKQLIEMARRRPELAARLRSLCERDLPSLNRHVLSKVMCGLETPEAITANLNLIDDAGPSPVPQGVLEQLDSAFIERRAHGQSPNAFTQHARASNELRVQLYKMAIGDEKRRKSACMLLGRVEEWRLEYGRPTGESRHPDLASGRPWPPGVLGVSER